MIQYLSRNQINEGLYNTCISNAVNSRIYAYSWYLDVVCDDWCLLVKDSYKTVMPLPIRKKYGIHYIYLAPWTQQLGIFSKENIESFIVKEFINSIPTKFKLIEFFLNADNVISNKYIKERDNFILPLNKAYKNIRKQYSKGRKSSIKQVEKFNLSIVNNYNHEKIIQLFKDNKGAELQKNKTDYDILSNLINTALPLKLVECVGVINDRNMLIGGAFFLKDSLRITYLFSAINTEGREKQAMSYLIDTMINRYAETEYILDFEGSMIYKLASFFKSFGAEKEAYYHFKKYRF